MSGDQEIRDRLTVLEVKHEERHKQVVDVLDKVQQTLQKVADNQAQMNHVNEQFVNLKDSHSELEKEVDLMKIFQARQQESLEAVQAKADKIPQINLTLTRHKVYMGILATVGGSAVMFLVKEVGSRVFQ